MEEKENRKRLIRKGVVIGIIQATYDNNSLWLLVTNNL